MPPLQLDQNKLKKAILILSFFLFAFSLFSKEKEYYFKKEDYLFLSPIENPDKKIKKILKYIEQKNYKKAKTRIYNLKLEFVNKEKCALLEAFVGFLEKSEDNGSSLLNYLSEEIETHKQIKAEILWLSGNKIESFNLYNLLNEDILNNFVIKKHIENRIINYCKDLDLEIENVLRNGEFQNLCSKIQSLPEKFFKENAYYKGRTLCAILERNFQESNNFLNLMEENERKDFEFFVEILGMDSSQQLNELKNSEFNERQKKLAKYIYSKTEDLWLLQNMPSCYSNAYKSEEINLKELSLLFCLYFPQIRSELEENIIKLNEKLEKHELECLYPLILSKVVEDNLLEKKINGDDFIFYLKKFVVFLNLLNPCEGNWESYVNCGMIPSEKGKEKIGGEFVASIIKKLRGE